MRESKRCIIRNVKNSNNNICIPKPNYCYTTSVQWIVCLLLIYDLTVLNNFQTVLFSIHDHDLVFPLDVATTLVVRWRFRIQAWLCISVCKTIQLLYCPLSNVFYLVYGHSFPRTFVPTRFLTGPDIRAHIKWPPRTFVLTSNDHPGHSCSHQITTRTFVLTSNDHPDIRSHDYSVL